MRNVLEVVWDLACLLAYWLAFGAICALVEVLVR